MSILARALIAGLPSIVASDDQWRTLCRVMGESAWAMETRFATIQAAGSTATTSMPTWASGRRPTTPRR